MFVQDNAQTDLISDLDALLWELAQRYRCEVLKAYERHDLAGADVRLVEALAHGADTPKMLARTLGWPPPHVTTILNRLTARGLILRSQNPRDARSVQIAFTPAGQELVVSVKAKRQARLETILTGVTAEKRERLQRCLARLTDAMTTSDETNI